MRLVGRGVEAEEEEMAASSVESLGISPESVLRAEGEEGAEGGVKYHRLIIALFLHYS